MPVEILGFVQVANSYTIISLQAAKAKAARMCYSFSKGWSIRISSFVTPEASPCRISITVILFLLYKACRNVFPGQLKCKKKILSCDKALCFSSSSYFQSEYKPFYKVFNNSKVFSSTFRKYTFNFQNQRQVPALLGDFITHFINHLNKPSLPLNGGYFSAGLNHTGVFITGFKRVKVSKVNLPW